MTDTLIAWEEFETSGFFANMRRKLKIREHKNFDFKDIKSIPLNILIEHFSREYLEMLEAIKKKDYFNIQEESLDVANCCAMIFTIIHNKPKEVIEGIGSLFNE